MTLHKKLPVTSFWARWQLHCNSLFRKKTSVQEASRGNCISATAGNQSTKDIPQKIKKMEWQSVTVKTKNVWKPGSNKHIISDPGEQIQKQDNVPEKPQTLQIVIKNKMQVWRSLKEQMSL